MFYKYIIRVIYVLMIHHQYKRYNQIKQTLNTKITNNPPFNTNQISYFINCYCGIFIHLVIIVTPFVMYSCSVNKAKKN